MSGQSEAFARIKIDQLLRDMAKEYLCLKALEGETNDATRKTAQEPGSGRNSKDQ